MSQFSNWKGRLDISHCQKNPHLTERKFCVHTSKYALLIVCDYYFK